MASAEEPGLEDRIARLEAHHAIRQLAHRYAAALDSRDVAALVELFVEDAPVTRERRGREALAEVFFGDPLRRVRTTILHVGTHVIELHGSDDASGSVYCRAEIELGEGRWITQAIHYGDRYARRSGRWLFVRRDHELFYGVDAGERPVGQPPAEWPRRDTGKGTRPEAWRTWQRFWSKP